MKAEFFSMDSSVELSHVQAAIYPTQTGIGIDVLLSDGFKTVTLTLSKGEALDLASAIENTLQHCEEPV